MPKSSAKTVKPDPTLYREEGSNENFKASEIQKQYKDLTDDRVKKTIDLIIGGNAEAALSLTRHAIGKDDIPCHGSSELSNVKDNIENVMEFFNENGEEHNKLVEEVALELYKPITKRLLDGSSEPFDSSAIIFATNIIANVLITIIKMITEKKKNAASSTANPKSKQAKGHGKIHITHEDVYACISDINCITKLPPGLIIPLRNQNLPPPSPQTKNAKRRKVDNEKKSASK